MARNLRAHKALIKSFCSRWPGWSRFKKGENQKEPLLVFKTRRVLWSARPKRARVQVKVTFKWILKTHKDYDIKKRPFSQLRTRVVLLRKPLKIKTRTELTAFCSQLMNTTIAHSTCSSSNRVRCSTQTATESGTKSLWMAIQAITKLPPPTVYSTRCLASLAFWRMRTFSLLILQTKQPVTRQKLTICDDSRRKLARTRTPQTVRMTISVTMLSLSRALRKLWRRAQVFWWTRTKTIKTKRTTISSSAS